MNNARIYLFYKGLLNEEDINSFNLPVYSPCIVEMKAIIEYEGTFSLNKLETIEVNWDMRDENEKIKSEDSSGKIMGKTVRAVLEPLLATHFGYNCMDKLFERYAIHVTEHLSQKKNKVFQY